MRFIHIADVHLGAVPDSGCPWSALREKEIWETFKKVISLAGKEKIDLLLIAGDLFHRQPLVREVREVNYLFSTVPEVQVVWMAGNHDYMKTDSAYRKIQWAENVHGFFSQQPEEIYLPQIKTWIYGFSYEHREIRDNLYHSIHPNGKPGHHILLAHGGDEKHIPLKKENLEAFDYAAVGHIHKHEILLPNKAAYAGALEPLDRTHIGTHGFIYGQIEKGVTRIRFVPAACRSYMQLEMDVKPSTTQLELEQMVKDEITARGENHLYLIKIKGYRNPDMDFDMQGIYRLGNIVEAEDASLPFYDLEKLKKQQEGTLIGEYIQCFEGKDSILDKKALYYGLQALMETEV